MLIDCDTCAAREIACGDCVVAVLLGTNRAGIELDSAEQDALGAFASGGLLPPLRLVPTTPPADPVHQRERHQHLPAPGAGRGRSAIA
jgi:hypothetical protein